MSDAHINTRELPAEQAKKHLEVFDAELQEIVKRYELHSLIYCAAMCVESADPDGSVLSSGNFYGCVRHGLIFLARFLGNTLSMENLSGFLNVISHLAAKRLGDEATTFFAGGEEPKKNDAEAENLFIMSLPTDNKYGPN